MSEEQRTYCGGRYRVRTIPVEMRMSHSLNAPIVERVGDGAAPLDLSGDLWDLTDFREAGDTLILVMLKYPGLTSGVEVRILPEPGRFELAGCVLTHDELLAALRAFP